jgi:tellurite resistance protein TerC
VANGALRRGQFQTWVSDFFGSAPLKAWLVLAGTCLALCALDWTLLRGLPTTFTWQLAPLCVWVSLAVVFDAIVWMLFGESEAFQWVFGYALEWVLSIDNLMVFHLVFSIFRTPAKQIHKAVFIGIIFAACIRLVFFIVVAELITMLKWFKYPLAALIIWSGFQSVMGDDDEDIKVEDMRVTRVLKWLLGERLSDRYSDDGSMIIWDESGRFQVTMLFVVVACIECTDLFFAMDSVSAKVAIIPNQFTAFSSSVLAMFGLRAMFFVIKYMVDMFDLLPYGLCAILVFIGVQLAISDYVAILPMTSCAVILGTFFVCVVGSVVKTKYNATDKELEDEASDTSRESTGHFAAVRC